MSGPPPPHSLPRFSRLHDRAAAWRTAKQARLQSGRRQSPRAAELLPNSREDMVVIEENTMAFATAAGGRVTTLGGRCRNRKRNYVLSHGNMVEPALCSGVSPGRRHVERVYLGSACSYLCLPRASQAQSAMRRKARRAVRRKARSGHGADFHRGGHLLILD